MWQLVDGILRAFFGKRSLGCYRVKEAVHLTSRDYLLGTLPLNWYSSELLKERLTETTQFGDREEHACYSAALISRKYMQKYRVPWLRLLLQTYIDSPAIASTTAMPIVESVTERLSSLSQPEEIILTESLRDYIRTLVREG